MNNLIAGICLLGFAVLMAGVITLANGLSSKIEQSRYDLTACEALKMELSK